MNQEVTQKSLQFQVILFSWNLTNYKNITGEQIGSYFGYSMAVGDIDGDKRDDLIVGAPMFTTLNKKMKFEDNHYENGAVYVFLQQDGFRWAAILEGITSKGRFGLALASLGDINQDGYGDFAVGAPYDGVNGRGAVHIYHGSPNGPREKASQIIYAEDVQGNERLTTFGFALGGGGIDLDRNLYPDMVVGAYNSGKVFMFR